MQQQTRPPARPGPAPVQIATTTGDHTLTDTRDTETICRGFTRVEWSARGRPPSAPHLVYYPAARGFEISTAVLPLFGPARDVDVFHDAATRRLAIVGRPPGAGTVQLRSKPGSAGARFSLGELARALGLAAGSGPIRRWPVQVRPGLILVDLAAGEGAA